MDLHSPDDTATRKIRDSTPSAVLGTVVTVFEHTEADDDSNHEANIILRDGGKELRRVPIVASRNGEAIVPEEGDYVLVSYLGGQQTAPLITGVLHTGQNRAPLARSGHWRQRFGVDDDLFVEAEPKDHGEGPAEVVRIAKKPDGLSDPVAEITLDDSTSPPTITLETQGDIHINAGGSVTLGDVDGQPVARKGDAVSVDPDTGNGQIDEGSANVDAS